MGDKELIIWVFTWSHTSTRTNICITDDFFSKSSEVEKVDWPKKSALHT